MTDRIRKELKSSYKLGQKELFSLDVCNVGHQICGCAYQWGPGVRDHYLIHLILSGKGTFFCEGKEYRLTAGDSFLIYPNREIFYAADPQDPWTYSWVGFIGKDAPSILRATGFSWESPVMYHSSHTNELAKEMKAIFDKRGTDFIQTAEMTGHLFLLLSIYMSESDLRVRKSLSEDYCIRAIDYISTNYSQPVSIEDIAAYIGISRSHLFRSFQTVLNQSPKEYLTDYRISQACYLLTHSNYSMKMIAKSVGFDNSLYFSKAFHKKKGVTPSAYRQREQET